MRSLTDQFDCIIYVGYRDKDHDYQVILWSHARKWPKVYGSLLTRYTHDFDCYNSSYLRTEHTIQISILSQFYSQISKINVTMTSADLENWAHILTWMLKCNTMAIFFFCERENAEFQFKDLKSLLDLIADFIIS